MTSYAGTSGQAARQGFDPINQTVTDWQQQEILGLAGGAAFNKPGDSGIKLNCPLGMKNRKLYFWGFTQPIPFNFNVNGEIGFGACFWAGTINFLKNGTNVGTLPVGEFHPILIIADDGFNSYANVNFNPPKSVTSFYTAWINAPYETSWPTPAAPGNSSSMVPDSISFFLSSPQRVATSPVDPGPVAAWSIQPNFVSIPPVYFDGEFDTVTLTINEVRNCGDIRLFLGIASTA